MSKLFQIVGFGALVLALVLTVGAFLLLKTPAGRQLTASVIETQLGSRFGGTMKIARLDGDLPGELILRGIEISDAGETWMIVNSVVVEWRPFALLRGHIEIKTLSLDGVSILNKPPSRTRRESDRQQSLYSLPRNLPSISVQSFSLSNLTVTESIAGRPLTLDGAGHVRLGGRSAELRFEAGSAGDSDTVSATIAIDPAADRGVIDILIASEADGAISSILGLEGRALLEIVADAPVDAFVADIDGSFGKYGSLDARIDCDLTDPRRLSATAVLTLGEKLRGVATEFGDHITVDGSIANNISDSTIIVDSLISKAGEISGEIVWTDQRDGVDSLTMTANAVFAPEYRPGLFKWIGGNATLELNASHHDGAYDVDASLLAPRLTLTIRDGRSDLRKQLTGPATLSINSTEMLSPLLAGGAELASNFDLATESGVALDALKVRLVAGAEFLGSASYAWNTDTLNIDGQAKIDPVLLRTSVTDISVVEPLAAAISVRGAESNIIASIDGITPRLDYKGATVPRSKVVARVDRLPTSVSAIISAQAFGDAGSLAAQIDRNEKGLISIDRLNLKSPSFALTGAGNYAADSEVATINLRYSGSGPAEPWPGFPLSGDLTAVGKIDRRGHTTDLVIDAQDIVTGDVRIGLLKARASGPASAVRLSTMADNIDIPVVGAVNKLKSTASIDLADGVALEVSTFEALAAEVPVILKSPTSINFDDEVLVSNLNAAIGARGSVKVDGSFSGSRWRATVAAESVPVHEASSMLSLNLDLDTDQRLIASGDFAARSVLTKRNDATISGQFAWYDDGLQIKNTDPADAIDFTVTLPAALVRDPKLSVNFKGPVGGEAKYEGALQALAPYLPSPLQSLEGRVEAAANISGTISNPAINGELTIRDAAYTELVSGLTLVGIHGQANASASAGGTRIDFQASGRGAGQKTETITANGEVYLGDRQTISLEMTMDGARFAAGPVDPAIATGTITLAGPVDTVVLNGALNVSELNAEIVTPPAGGLIDINVVPINGDGQADAPTPLTTPPQLKFNVSFVANDRIFIRGRGLETEWRADIKATGDTNRPLLTGAMVLRRGHLDFSGRRFNVSRGQIAFDRLSPNDPVLDIRAELQTGAGVTAAIEIGGRASAPKIALVSTPSLPPDEIMALVLFGKPAAELSALETLQVAQALAELTGVGPFGNGGGITSIARQALGLDMLNIDIDTDTGASSLEVGKYVADGLFVAASQDARGENGSVRVEYEITDSITVETEIKQDGDQTVSANWKRDF